MSEKPLVSIVINCFNGEKYLRQAIDSIIFQTYKNWEIIFWDNQSTDKSAEIFNSYKDERLKYYYSTFHTKILYEAKNFALKKTKGEFIAFLDVDDWWMPNKLAEQIPLFNDPKVGLVYGNLFLIFEKNKKKKIYRKKTLPKGMILNELLGDYFIGSPTYVVRRKAIESLEYFFDKKFHIIGDFDLNTRLASKWKLDCIQHPVAYVRIHGQNESLLNRNIEIEELKTWFEKNKNNPNFSIHSKLQDIPLMWSYLEIMENILKKSFFKSFLMVMKYPTSLKKIKLLIALLLPNFVLKKIKNY